MSKRVANSRSRSKARNGRSQRVHAARRGRKYGKKTQTVTHQQTYYKGKPVDRLPWHARAVRAVKQMFRRKT